MSCYALFMTGKDHILYKALVERDKTYDGLFYFGVTSTGIYCRPICPANKPKAENVLFFTGADDAVRAGFRACKRCRPESRPGSPAWKGTEATVSRALRLIAEGALEEGSLEMLADRLGISDRHLRRLFSEHINKSPIDVASERRINIAKGLLLKSNHTIADIAYAAGFSSLRRFNDSFKKTTGQTPSLWRRGKSHGNR